MKKLLYLLSAVALMLTSCSSDDDTQDTSGTLLTKIVETYSDGTVENITFTYNGNKIVKISSDYSERDETIYTYTGDLITKEEYFFDDGAGDSFNEVVEYEYDANQKLIKSTTTPESGAVEIDNFTYNSNGTVSFVTTSGGATIATGTIYFNGNQPYKKEITENTISRVEVDTFDDKVNPFVNITGYSKIIIGNPSNTLGYPGIVNNNLSTSKDGSIEYSSTYTYNSNNMPATEIYVDYNNSDYNSTSQYFYN